MIRKSVCIVIIMNLFVLIFASDDAQGVTVDKTIQDDAAVGQQGDVAETSDDMSDFFDMSLEDLMNIRVVTASKRDEPEVEAPGIVTVITAAEINAFGAKNLMDIFERAPSLQPVSSHFFRNNILINRGVIFSHDDRETLILLNGRPLRESLSGDNNNAFFTSFLHFPKK